MALTYDRLAAEEGFALTGEKQLLGRLERAKIDTILDVGANRGEWTSMARKHFPSARIHAFEIMPEVYRKFIDNTVLDNRIIPNGFGLGEKIGTIPMKYFEDNDYFNTHLGMLNFIADLPFQWRECLTVTGDAYMKHHKIDHIDFLKIDVEGGEHLVMKGFIEAMSAGKIGCIQFEYGLANIVSRWLLVDFHELLTPLGYIFGKLSPDGVAFKKYNLNDENFIGPNIVAVHQSRQDLVAALST